MKLTPPLLVLFPQGDCNMGLTKLGGTLPDEMETVITALRLKTDSRTLIFNSCIHFQPKETKRWKKMQYCIWMECIWPDLLAKEWIFKFFMSSQETTFLSSADFSKWRRYFKSRPLFYYPVHVYIKGN
jgi:hypothetical protein